MSFMHARAYVRTCVHKICMYIIYAHIQSIHTIIVHTHPCIPYTIYTYVYAYVHMPACNKNYIYF